MNSGQTLWKRAKQIIPGGNQLLSKRAERFLPDLWPAYYQRAKGCEIWDLDGNHYYDFAQMGVGACVLGYADPDVDQACKRAIDLGGMCTLNAPEEVELAERLLALHPWADRARFARTGGEACAVAVRIARAAIGRHRVAFCGYHGWHDWYLSANLGDGTSLDGQLLPGLEPCGVPRGLEQSALPFHYNNLDSLEAIATAHDDLGVIIMEPQRGNDPAPGFLEGVRALATRIGAVLIFDEVTSAFRMNLGGIHLRHGVEPDVAVFGKALGNGYPIAAVIGQAEVMEAAQATFISSTMWTERLGYTAALATLDKMTRENVPAGLTRDGLRVSQAWRTAAAAHGLDVRIDGIPPLTHCAFGGQDPLALATLYTQEMLDRGFLAGTAVYATHAYTDAILDAFAEAVDEVFALLARAEAQGDARARLRGPVIQPGFKRLT